MAETPKILQLAHGIHTNVDHAVYHERIVGMVSKGALDKVHQSPAHYDYWVHEKDVQTPAKLMGGALHCALLESEEVFASRYALMPSWNEHRDARGALSTKIGKEKKAAWVGANEGKLHLEGDDVETIGAMIASVRKHPLASKMIQNGVPEVTVRWRDRDTGLECRARADYYVKARRMIVDVKTTQDASRDAFRRDIVKYRYQLQDAIYRAAFGAVGEPVEHFVYVVIEKAPPYAVAIYSLDAMSIQRGYTSYRADIERLAECIRNDDFPAYPATIQTLELPPWAA